MEGDFRIEQWLVQPHLNTVVRPDSESARLEPKVMAVLVFLADRAGEVVSKEAIFQAVWHDTFVTDDALIRCIVELRKVFEDDVKEPRIIQTIAKKGYRLIGKVSKLAEAGSRYEIVRKLGQGGMAEVFLAKDRELRRNVALKFLPEDRQQDEHLRKRLMREARAAAALDHPFICKIYDVGEMDGKPYIAMEYLEGQTLKQRLESGRLPMKEALKTGLEIAEALEAAHEHGIVHRDLKPANVIMTAQGHAKVLDFGLAKQVVPQGGIDSQDRTISALTRREVTVGTLAYMSPEQLRGEAVDGRSDIFSFGIVMYEMVTGIHPFRKGTGVETSSAILNVTPNPISQYLASAPALLDHAVRKMLAKDAGRRYQVIQDVRTDLQEVAEESAAPQTAVNSVRTAEGTPQERSVAVKWLAGALLGTAVLVSAVVSVLTTVAPHQPIPVTRSSLKLEAGYWLAGAIWEGALQRPSRTAVSISRNGDFVVYSAVAENPGSNARPQLYVRRIFQIEAKPIPGTEGGINPFLSPDDRWVGFFEWMGLSDEHRLKKVSLDGGAPVTLCETACPLGASWGPDDRIIFTTGALYGETGLSIVPAAGGAIHTLTVPDKKNQQASHRLPHHLPARKGVLFTIMDDIWDWEPQVAVLDPVTRQLRIVLENAADACYVSSRHLVFLRDGDMMAVPFDLDRLQVTGQPVPVVLNVMQALGAGNSWYHTAAGQFSVSTAGSLVYVPGGIVPEPEQSLVWMDRNGKSEPAVPFKGRFGAVCLSPDGKRIAYSARDRGKGRIWVYDPDRGTTSPVTGEGKTHCLAWTPDGTHLVFGWRTGDHADLYWAPADGSMPMEQLTRSEYWQIPGSYSPDGSTLALVDYHLDRNPDILLFDSQTRQTTPFGNIQSYEIYPEFSPDGRWMAFVSMDSDRMEVYVRPYPVARARWQVSHAGGIQPHWSRDGKQLFYRWQDQVWVVDVRTDGGFAPGKPRLLFSDPACRADYPLSNYDVSADGMRLLIVRSEASKPQPVTEMILVQNWLEELKRLVPVK